LSGVAGVCASSGFAGAVPPSFDTASATRPFTGVSVSGVLSPAGAPAFVGPGVTASELAVADF
jgi:hypothetical protein